ncbi:MAG: helix-turn-helix domain-containing protein [bacterium]|nr:helix-turn-helix domain-containing protein [bacterium]
MSQITDITLDETKQLVLVAKALSAEARIEILKLLRNREMNINEISEQLKIPASSAAAHIRVLEEASLIKTNYQPGIRGSMKLCQISMDEIHINLLSKFDASLDTKTYDMPIGNYVDYKVTPTCGLVDEKGAIDEEDEPRCFYNPARNTAKLLWLGDGYVEYRFPNNELLEKTLKKISISAELCSEDHEYNMDCPSDLSMWINDICVGTWSCPSDFGGRRGKLNPEWWPDKNTQFGILKTWSVTENGSYIDGIKVSEVTLNQLKLEDNDFISVRIGIAKDAQHKGGMNLFGDSFGDYPQNILMHLIFQK